MNSRFLASCFTILLVLTASLSIAQEVIFNQKIDTKKLTDVGGLVDSEFFIVKARSSPTEFTIYVLSKEKGVLHAYKIPCEEIRFLYSTTSNDELNIYFNATYSQSTLILECITFSKKIQKFINLTSISPEDGVKPLQYFVMDNKFYSLSTSKKDFVVIEYKRTNPVTKIPFSIDDDKLLRHIKKSTIYQNSSNMMGSFDEVVNQNKIYAKGDELIIISDDWKPDNDKELAIIKLNLNNKKVDNSIQPLPLDRKTDHNSFLFEDRLFVFGINHDLFSLNVFDLSGNHIKDFTYISGQQIELDATGLKKNKVFGDKFTEYESTENLHTKLNRGLPVIGVSANGDNGLRLLIGNYIQPKAGPGVMTGGSSMAMGGMGPTFAPGAGSREIKEWFISYLTKDRLSIDRRFSDDQGILTLGENRVNSLNQNIKEFDVINGSSDPYLIYVDNNDMFHIEKL